MMTSEPFAPRTFARSGVARALLWGGAAGAAAAAVRYGLIELDFFRSSCETPLPLWCLPRQALVLIFNNWVFGAVSVVFGVFALLKPERSAVALTAVIFGAIGLALYNAGPASLGFVFGLATLARKRA